MSQEDVEDFRYAVTASSTSLPETLEKGQDQSIHYLDGVKLCLVIASFMIIVALDGFSQLILSSSGAAITSQFGPDSDISWITSILAIVEASFTLIYGKILNITPPKTVVLFACGIFILGSFICAVAPTFGVLILGRAIIGFGCAGIWNCVLSIISRISPLSQRPLLVTLMVACYGLCNGAGPIIGAVLSEKLNFRWCFYPNLPLTGLAMLIMVFFLPNLPALAAHKEPLLNTWLRQDWIGTFLSAVGVFSLLAGLQWGGDTQSWNTPGVIASIVVGFLLLGLFVVWEIRAGPEAILAVSMLKRRNLVGTYLVSGFIHWATILITLYLPIIYQVRGLSVITSSVELFPLIGSEIFGAILSGVAVARTGHVWIWLFLTPFLTTFGYALLAVSNVGASAIYLTVCQILVGFGLGAPSQHPIVIVQAEFTDQPALIPQATSLISFVGILFNAVGTTTGSVVFSEILRSQVQKLNLDLPNELMSQVLENAEILVKLPESLRTLLVNAYTIALRLSLLSAAVITSLASLSALLISRRRIS